MLFTHVLRSPRLAEESEPSPAQKVKKEQTEQKWDSGVKKLVIFDSQSPGDSFFDSFWGVGRDPRRLRRRLAFDFLSRGGFWLLPGGRITTHVGKTIRQNVALGAFGITFLIASSSRRKRNYRTVPNGGFRCLWFGDLGARDSGPRDRALSAPKHCMDA